MSPWLENIMRRPVAAGVAYATLIVGGMGAFVGLPVELAPTAELPALEVSTAWEHVSSETVEEMITAPLEEIAGTLYGVRRINSVSEEGHSRVTIEFDPKTEMDAARFTLREQLAVFSERLPQGASTPTIRSSLPEELRDLRGFLSYSLAGGRTASALREYAKAVIVPRLMSVQGVKTVNVFGGAEQEVQITLFPDRMAALGMNPDELKKKLLEIRPRARTSPLRHGNIRGFVSIDSDLSSIRDLRRMVVAVTPGGAQVRLSDIAATEVGLAASTGIFRLNGKPAVVIRLDKESQVNMFHVAALVEEAIQQLRSRLPKGMEIIKESDKSEHMRDELGRLSNDILLSVLCIVIVLQLLVKNVRVSVVVLTSIMSLLAATFLLFRAFSVTLHLFTLAGLVLGITRIVENAIIIMDSIQLQSDRKGDHGILRVMEETARPLSVSTLTALGTLVPPAVLLHGVVPHLSDFALAFGISLASSFIVSLTFLPTIARVFPVRWSASTLPVHHRFPFASMYHRLLKIVIRKRWWVIGLAFWVVGIPAWVIPDHLAGGNGISRLYNIIFESRFAKMFRDYVQPVLGGSSYLFATQAAFGRGWDPGGKTHILVRITLPQGTEATLYEEVASVIEQAVTCYRRHLENVATLIIHDGAFLQVNVTDSASRTPIPHEVRELLSRPAARIGGTEIGIYGFGSGFAGSPGVVPSFLVEVSGYEYGKVKEIAGRFQTAIQRNPRITDVNITGAAGGRRNREVVALIHREVLSRSGVSINETIHALGRYAGSTPTLGDVRLNGKMLPLRVVYAGHHDFSVHDLESAVVTTGSGRTFRLSSFIALEEREMEGRITRENQEYVRWVRCGYKGPHGEGERFLSLAMTGIGLPPGYAIHHVLPTAVIPVKSAGSAWWCVPAIASIIFMVTAAFFESYAKAFVVLFSVVVSFVGPFLVFSFPSLSFGSGGYAVFFVLIGIVTTNAILLLDSIPAFIDNDDVSPLTIIGAASRRAPTVLKTTATTIGGIIPFLLITDADNPWHSLFWGIAGGLSASLGVILIIVPVVYSAVVRPRRTPRR